MSARRCPCCGHRQHTTMTTLQGLTVFCDRCGTVLANRRDTEAAPTTLSEGEAALWQEAGSFVLEGAEAEDPADDAIFGPRREPVLGLAW